MKKVWVIEQGSYSDYRVVGVFTSEAKAQKVVDALKATDNCYDEPTIAEWPLDPAIEELNAGMEQWRVLMLKDGTVERVDHCSLSAYNLVGTESLWHRSQAPAYRGTGAQDALDMVVWAESKKHAVKIVNERREQMIAEEKWK